MAGDASNLGVAPSGEDNAVTLLLFVVAIAVFAALAMRESSLWQWGAAVLAIGLLSGIGFTETGMVYGLAFGSWVLLMLGAVLLALSIEPLRKAVLATPIFGAVKSILPKVSRTEQEALDAGTVGWDAELFSGRPDWDKLMKIRPLTLTAEEQAFLDNETETACRMIDD